MAQHIDTVQQEREELTNAYQALKETLESALDTLHNYYQQAHQQLDTPTTTSHSTTSNSSTASNNSGPRIKKSTSESKRNSSHPADTWKDNTPPLRTSRAKATPVSIGKA